MGEKSVGAIFRNGSAKIKNGTDTFRFGNDTHSEPRKGQTNADSSAGDFDA